jgi:hypothetical protein
MNKKEILDELYNVASTKYRSKSVMSKKIGKGKRFMDNFLNANPTFERIKEVCEYLEMDFKVVFYFKEEE